METEQQLIDVEEWLHLRGGDQVISTVATVTRPLTTDELDTAYLVPLAKKLAGVRTPQEMLSDPYAKLDMIPVYTEHGQYAVPRSEVRYGSIVQVDKVHRHIVHPADPEPARPATLSAVPSLS